VLNLEEGQHLLSQYSEGILPQNVIDTGLPICTCFSWAEGVRSLEGYDSNVQVINIMDSKGRGQ